MQEIENGIVAGAIPLLWDNCCPDSGPERFARCDRCGKGIYHADRDSLYGDSYWTDGEEIVCASCVDKMTDEEIGRYGEETA